MRRRLSFGSAAEMIQSSSDDQLYRGKRRKSVYSGSPVSDGNDGNDIGEIKTSEGKPSASKPILRRKMIEFEGDGPLGIVFTMNNELLSIKSIMKGSVASEYYELEIGMNVIQINDISCRGLGYVKSMECLGKLWRTNSSVTLHFEYENPNDLINDPIHSPVYQFLEGIDCEEFYGNFDELGAKSLEDLKFIENDDLVKMNMSLVKRREFQLLTKDTFSKSLLTITFHESMNETDRTEEIERLRSSLCYKYIIDVNDEVLIEEDV
jgi:hypothetical protein